MEVVDRSRGNSRANSKSSLVPPFPKGALGSVSRGGSETASQYDGNLSERGSVLTARPRQKDNSTDRVLLDKREYEAQQKKKEHAVRHGRLLETRAADEKAIKERSARNAQAREQRFQELLENLRANDPIRVDAARTINKYELDNYKKRQELHDEWDVQVCQRVERQLLHFMSRGGETESMPEVEGGKTYRENLLASDCPIKRYVHDNKVEERFRRTADQIVRGPCPAQMGKDKLRALIKERENEEKFVAERLTSRPVLPVEQWDQQRHYASINGYFAQLCEGGPGSHTARRTGTGVHMIDESDGVVAAGKTRIRNQRGLPGLLVGTVAKEGESAKYKTPHGCSCGAPCQDHYRFEKGQEVVETEFPLGKRCFPDLN